MFWVSVLLLGLLLVSPLEGGQTAAMHELIARGCILFGYHERVSNLRACLFCACCVPFTICTAFWM